MSTERYVIDVDWMKGPLRGLTHGHDGRRWPDHDWQVVGRCQRCGGPVLEMRRAGAYARQEECRPWCRTQQQAERIQTQRTKGKP